MSEPGDLNFVRGEEITLGDRRFALTLVELRGKTVFWNAVDLDTGESEEISVDRDRGCHVSGHRSSPHSTSNPRRSVQTRLVRYFVVLIVFVGLGAVLSRYWSDFGIGGSTTDVPVDSNTALNGADRENVAIYQGPFLNLDTTPAKPELPPEPETPDPKLVALRAKLEKGDWLDSESFEENRGGLQTLQQEGVLKAGEFISVYGEPGTAKLIGMIEAETLQLREASKNQVSLRRLGQLGYQDALQIQGMIAELDKLNDLLGRNNPLGAEDFMQYRTLLERLASEGDDRAIQETDFDRKRSEALVFLNSGRPLSLAVFEKRGSVFEELLSANDVPDSQRLRLCQQLGLYYLMLAKDQTKAMTFFMQGAQMNDPASMVQYAQIANQQHSSSEEPLIWLKKSVSLNYSDAKMLLADYYQRHGGGGSREIRQLLTDAATEGNARAQTKLGFLHWKGNENDFPIDVKKSRTYFMEAKESGFGPAFSNLGALYWEEAFSETTSLSTAEREALEQRAVQAWIDGAGVSDVKSVKWLLTCLRNKTSKNFSYTSPDLLVQPIVRRFSEADLTSLLKELEAKPNIFITDGLQCEFDTPSDA